MKIGPDATAHVSLTPSRHVRGSNFIRLFQTTTKRKKVCVESVAAAFFTPHECGSLGADALCSSVGPGYGAVPERWSAILQHADPRKRRRRISPPFLLQTLSKHNTTSSFPLWTSSCGIKQIPLFPVCFSFIK